MNTAGSDLVLTSVEAVKLYLAQISRHNHDGLYPNAIVSVAERDTLLAQARELDRERSQGKIRGPFHGVPVVLKDLCNTIDMPTTRESYAFKQCKPKKDANLIHTLTAAGLIILAKANQRDNNQKALEAGRDTTITEEQYDRNFEAICGAASLTLLNLMKEYSVDVLLGPCDSQFNSLGAVAGFPIGNLPLSFADFNGRPFSLHAIAPAGEEDKIFQVMSA
ncbi:hypothetical protein BHE90_001797 [Fusarium euwallaceae]|uniref:Amidase domain-containing protein n=2 Tax=Fusarium solani species complex TaxID=232080 RepID=A0A430M6M6_9HYPO|nr:hypothetical protein CEP51_003282 [Fusarium floridanum]RTE83615.1 hypothetical protein BHE90_001797 [Fusarium euwallaceae]